MYCFMNAGDCSAFPHYGNLRAYSEWLHTLCIFCYVGGMKVIKFIGLLLIAVVIMLVILFVFSQNAPAPQIVANVTELDKIEKISKFRSCAGHTTVPQNESEMKRNMKHYFWVKREYLEGNTVEIYAPYDGFVTGIRKDLQDGLEGEIWIAPKDMFVILPPVGRWMFSVQHINVRQDLKRGSEVKAGELIGHAAVTAANRETFDIVYAKGAFAPKNIDNWTGPFTDLDSIFNHLSDAVFSKYNAKGVTSRQEAIITKEDRDQNPCVYKDNGPYFLNQDAPENWIIFNQ